MYAIVDIETTGGYASNNDIIEVAIVLFNGNEVTDRFVSLVKPRQEIPRYIQVLTGISPKLVEEAPYFEEIAPRIQELLGSHIFVAHNVNFDYSFLKHHLSRAGIEWSARRLCTVRLTKKVFPGLPSYSLGNLCRQFDIGIKNRHRAGGDADATILLLEHLLRHEAQPHIEAFIRRGSREQSLPAHLPREQVDQLPYTPGVYYFHDQKDRIIYVGKAKNLRYRVRSHFTHNGPGRQRQEFLRNIHRISYQPCGTELMAFILESIEIKRLWPRYNHSQKKFTQDYGLYAYTDQNGYLRLLVDKRRKNVPTIHTFNLRAEAHLLLQQLVREYKICPKLCFIQTSEGDCVGMEASYCKGACCGKEKPDRYNKRVQRAIAALQQDLPSFAIIESDPVAQQKTCILMEQGDFYGMGILPEAVEARDLESLRPHLTRYPGNEYIRGLMLSYAERFPGKVWSVTSMA